MLTQTKVINANSRTLSKSVSTTKILNIRTTSVDTQVTTVVIINFFLSDNALYNRKYIAENATIHTNANRLKLERLSRNENTYAANDKFKETTKCFLPILLETTPIPTQMKLINVSNIKLAISLPLSVMLISRTIKLRV